METTNEPASIHVEPKAKKTVEKTLRKLDKVIAKLKEDGWITSDDATFYHPLAKTGQEIRERLHSIDLLTTSKCRIWIKDTQSQVNIEIA